MMAGALRWLLHVREPNMYMEVGIQGQEMGYNTLAWSQQGREREVPEFSTPTTSCIIYGVLTILQTAH